MLLAAVLAGGLAVPAYAATTTLDAKVVSETPGSTAQPATAAFDVTISAEDPGGPYPQSAVEVHLPPPLKVDGAGFAVCDAATISAQGEAGCPAGSQVGAGSARFLVGPFKSETHKSVKAYNGTSGTLVLSFTGTPSFVATGTITTSPDPAYGQRIAIPLPAAAREPLPGVRATLAGLHLHVQRHRTGGSYVTLGDCPTGQLTFKSVLTYDASVEGAPAGPVVATDDAACQVGALPEDPGSTPGTGGGSPSPSPSPSPTPTPTPGAPTPTPTPTPGGTTGPGGPSTTTPPVGGRPAGGTRQARRAVRRFKVRLRKRGRRLVVTGVRRGSRVRVTCLRRCGGAGRRLASRAGGPRKLKVKLRRTIRRRGRFEVRVSAPDRIARYARYKRGKRSMRVRRTATGLVS